MVETAVEHFGAIHCLLNNVGWHPPRNPIDDVDEQGLRDLLELNVISYFNFCKVSCLSFSNHKYPVTTGSMTFYLSDYVMSSNAIVIVKIISKVLLPHVYFRDLSMGKAILFSFE